MLAGRYPSDEFAELRPRIVWDRIGASIRGRDSARRLAVMSGGTIPDRGLYGVFLADSGARVGELDEEMVYEARQGEVFQLGATSWRIEQITRDRVLVSPAPGVPGKMPFWKGDGIGRPSELGRAVGEATRTRRFGELDERAARNLAAYLDDQREATGVVPDDRTIVDRAVPRRDRRLAGVHALAVRRPRARALGDGDREADGRRAGHRGGGDLVRRRDRDPAARLGRAAAGRADRAGARRDRGPA